MSQPTIEMARRGQFLTISLNSIPHLIIHLPSLVGVQSWADHPNRLTKVMGKVSRYTIELTHKTTQNTSDYADRNLWSKILILLNEGVTSWQNYEHTN